MSEQRVIDLEGRFDDSVLGFKFLRAYVNPPFVLIQYARDGEVKKLMLRLDLDKRCFVESDAEEAISDSESHSLLNKARLLEYGEKIAEFIRHALARYEVLMNRIIQLAYNRSRHEDTIREINLELDTLLREFGNRF